MQVDPSQRDAKHMSEAELASTSRLSAIFVNLQNVAANIATTMSDVIAGDVADIEHLRLSADARALLQQQIVSELGKAQWCDGAGYANYSPPFDAGAAPAGDPLYLEDSEYWTLEWWASEPAGVRQVPLESDQGRQRRVDFRTFDWFREPANRRKAHVEGPYVDYVCNGSYTITAAHPVIVKGRFAGVGVADILVSTIEREMSPLLYRLSGPAVIINPNGRVVISTEPSIRPGALWPADDRWHVSDSPEHPFRLATRLPAEKS